MIDKTQENHEISSLSQLPTTATTINDVRNLVRFLKRKPSGISPLEITDIFRRRLFEPCKLHAFKTWGIISLENDRISLSSIGWRIAESLGAEAKEYRTILSTIESYRMALEWISDSGITSIPYFDISTLWKKNCPEVFPTADEKTSENCIINFFHLCHSAELGIASVGRKGQPTRLAVDHLELKSFLDVLSDGELARPTITNNNGHRPVSFENYISVSDNPMRLFVSCNQAADLSPLLRGVLEMTDMQYEIQVREEGEMLLSAHSRQVMHGCRGALILADENNQILWNKNYRFDDRLLSEIAASYALFEMRVLLIWKGEKPTLVPTKGLRVINVPDKLDWETGLELSRHIKELNTKNNLFRYLNSATLKRSGTPADVSVSNAHVPSTILYEDTEV